MTDPMNGVATLTQLGVLRAQGEDAAKFLHGQLTHDFLLLGDDRARLAALCSAKGRMLASFIGLRHGADEILLVMSRDILPQTLKRLSMFVLRAKVKLTDASGDFALYGLVGDAATSAASQLAEPWHKTTLPGGATVVRLYPAAGQPRALCIAPAGSTAPDGPALTAEQWQWTEVQSGVATITAPTAEAFVPQMLNYESVDGVNFKKGCYPGQEVVARSQFRGKLKRRAYVLHADAGPLVAGQEVFVPAADGGEAEACGTVVQAAPAPGGGWDAIASLQVAAADAGKLWAGATGDAALAVRTLPYALREDI